MQRRILRSAILATCAAISSGIGAAPALGAAVTLTPVAATAVTASSATLGATVTTAGYAISYQFEYGTTSAYGALTPAAAIPAGTTSVVPVSAPITGLKPNTLYHFDLAVSITTGNYDYPLIVGHDEDLSFKTTAAGKLTLTSTKPPVKRGVASIGVRCASTGNCAGKYSLRAKSGRKTVTCASGSISVAPGKHATLRAKLSKTCTGLLAHAKRGTLAATFAARLTTGQPAVTAKLTL